MERADLGQELTDDDVLSLWVGRVARSHAMLEYNVDNLRRFLARRVGQVPGNKSVKGHDMWLSDPVRSDWEPPRWNTFHRLNDLHESYNSATSQDLTTVVDTYTLLTRTRVRVSGLFMSLHATWPISSDPARKAPGRGDFALYVALMTDRFVLHANGDFDIA